jgi:hypothetical protein
MAGLRIDEFRISDPRNSGTPKRWGLFPLLVLMLTAAACGQSSSPVTSARHGGPPDAETITSAKQALNQCDLRDSQVWLGSSDFKIQNQWFKTDTRERVWVTDVNGDGISDVVGIAFSGAVLVSLGTGTSFSPATIWSNTVFTTAANWFTNTYRQRVWVADANADHLADIIGIDDAGGIYFYLNTGTSFVQKTTRPSPFSPFGSTPGDGWFDPRGSANPNPATRVWLADVTGDGRLDVVGVGNAGDIWVSPQSTNDTGFLAAVGPFTSSFSNAGGWFTSSLQDHVWAADVDGDHQADIVGIAANGEIRVSYSRWQQSGNFLATSTASVPTIFQHAKGWFASTSSPRVWVTDVSGDGKADVVGIAPPGVGDGDVWVARNVGIGFFQKPWLFESVFKTNDLANNWFATSANARIWLGDVSGDGLPDLVGVGTNGDVWVAKVSLDSTTNSSSPTEQSGIFLPALRVAQSGLGESAGGSSGFFNAALKRHVWLADVTGDHVSDIVAIRPTGNDGDILWTQALPTAVTAISNVTRQALNTSLTQAIDVDFSRRLDCAGLPSNALVVRERIGSGSTTTRPVTNISAAGLRTRCTFSATFQNPGSSDVKIQKDLQGIGLVDRFQQAGGASRWIDGNGDGFIECGLIDRATRVDYLTSGLVAGAAKMSLAYDYQGRPEPSYPSAWEPRWPFQYDPSLPPPMARMVLLGNGSGEIMVVVSVELAGVNPGRLRDLISARTGIPSRNVVIAATHAHATFHTVKLYTAPTFDDRTWAGPAPTAYDYPGMYPYLQWLEDSIADKVAATYATLTAAKVAVGTSAFPASTNDILMPDNRRDIDRRSLSARLSGGAKSTFDAACPTPVADSQSTHDTHDQTVGAISIYSSAGAPLAILVNYAMHPVILSAETVGGIPSVGLNSDFTGFMSSCIESGVGTNCPDLSSGLRTFPVALYVQAGAGDIDPTGTWSNELWRSREYGRRIAETALAVDASQTATATTGMRVKSKRKIHTLLGISNGNYTEDCPDYDQRPDGWTVDWDVESTSLVVGAPSAPLFAFATVPGEPFTSQQIALHDSAATGAQRTFLFGYANGYFGYFPDTEAASCTNGLAQTRGAAPSADLSCATSAPHFHCTGGVGWEPLPGTGQFGLGFVCYGASISGDSLGAYSPGPVFLSTAQSAGDLIVNAAVGTLNELNAQ